MNTGIRIVLFFIFLLLGGGSPYILAQGQAGILAGISNYQGDLASTNTTNGLQALIGPVAGLTFGYEWSKNFQFRSDLLYTRLAGDDALNPNENTRLRNLSFFTTVIQLTGGVDWNITGFNSRGEKDFSPYITAGVGVFYFNPKTEYQGRIVALRPLGTEGQFLDDYPDQRPYAPVQPSYQLGGGLKIMTTGKLILAIEGLFNLTFTDYIDDASTIYISYPELLAKAGELTAALANRQGELQGTEPVIMPTGTARANPKSDDFFGTITLKASVPVKITSNRFKVKGHNRKRVDCPKF